MSKQIVALTGALACFVVLFCRRYDSDPLRVNETQPYNGEQDVSRLYPLRVRFNNPLDVPATIASFTLMTLSGSIVPGMANVANDTFNFIPGALYQPSLILEGETSYLASFTGATDIHGSRLDSTFIFTTRGDPPPPPKLSVSAFAIFVSPDELKYCRAAVCRSQPGIDPYAADYPCPGAIIITSSQNTFRLDSDTIPRAQTLYFLFPYPSGGNAPWCWAVSPVQAYVPPIFINFTLPRPDFNISTFTPPNNQEGVRLDAQIVVFFSWYFVAFLGTVRAGREPIPGTWINSTKDIYYAQFSPAAQWAPNTTVDVSVVATDEWARQRTLSYRFTTRAYPEGPPEVSYIYPASDATVAPPPVISVNFNKPMDGASVEKGFSLLQIGFGARNGSITWRSELELGFRPFDALPLGQAFVVTIVGAVDRIGRMRLPDFSSMFHTTAPTRPSVVDTWPRRDAVSVPRTLTINVTFSTPMNTTSVQNGFLLTVIGGGRSSGTFAWRDSNSTLFYKPSAVLPPNRSMMLSIFDAQSESQQTLPDFSYTFHTGDTAWKRKEPVEDARRIAVSMNVVD